jgi:formylglycine-generating enzyme required for sulfatase activity
MQPPQTSVPGDKQAMDFGRRIGLSILFAVVAVVALWLQFQSDRVASLSNTAALTPMSSPDLARFRADAWYLPADTLLGFVEIPAGPFVMGSDPTVDPMAFENEQWSDSSNQGTVDLAAFYIGRYEVTIAQFRTFVAATHYRVAEVALSGQPDHPINNVSWTDALAYSRWLETQMKQSPTTPVELANRLRDGWRITIPNEVQWEKAARGADGRIYPWGNVASREYANYQNTSTTTVGSLTCPKCAFGLADMSGNVWELTRSVYQVHSFDLNTRPDLQADALFVMRGGSFSDPQNTVRAAMRFGIDPGVRRPSIGFRIVLTRD